MRIFVFLSYPKPRLDAQSKFVGELEKYPRSRGLEPRTMLYGYYTF